VGITKNDVLYCPFPLFHIDAATLTVIAALSAGATAAIAKRFSVSKFWDDVRKYEATIFNFMGATLSMLWKQPTNDADLTHQVRLAWGVPIPDWQPEFEKRFGFSIYQVYGLTDAGVMVYDPQDGSQKYGYAGKLIDEYDLKIVDFNLNPVPIGTLGEIMLKGKEPGLMMNGYYGMPEATAAAFVDGWYRTGDLGQLDNEQYLALLGRLADSIRRRGENISAFEVEEMVSAHPAVLEVGAIGVPSELTEEDVKVVVALKPGCSATHEEIYQFCVETGVKYMIPKYIEFMAVIPKTPTEKVQKYRLKEVWKNSNTWDTDTKLFLDSGSN
jgi:crotonobetaine/carnitine-CoA ligase